MSLPPVLLYFSRKNTFFEEVFLLQKEIEWGVFEDSCQCSKIDVAPVRKSMSITKSAKKHTAYLPS